MSLEYVKKKADTRAGKTVEEPKAKEVLDDDTQWVDDLKQQIDETTEEVVEQPKYSNLDNFINSDEIGEVSLKDLLADDDFYKSQDWFKDVENIPIIKMSQKELDKEVKDAYHTLGYVKDDEEEGIIGIYVNPKSTPQKVEKTILHEIRHTQQDPELAKTHKEKATNLDMNDEAACEKYYEEELERDADEWVEQQIKAKEDFNERTSNQKTTFNNDENTSSIRGLQDSERDSSLGVQQVEGDGGSLRAEPTNKPISERIIFTNTFCHY